MLSKNSFIVNNDKIYISNPEWDFSAEISYRDDVLNEIQNVTWSVKKAGNRKYLYNAKYGYLHTYIMKKWYGEDVYKCMRDKDFVVDHIDNNGANCCIENLAFLLNDDNKAKGLTFDKKNKEKHYIALSIIKDFDTSLVQITIHFNYPSRFSHCNVNGLIDRVYLLYDIDYEFVLLDASFILKDYYTNYVFEPQKLHMIDYYIEGYEGNRLSEEQYNRYLSENNGHTVATFRHIAPFRGWDKTVNVKYFHISGKGEGYWIEI